MLTGVLPTAQPIARATKPAVGFCEQHWAMYPLYRSGLECHIPKCAPIGIPFTPNSGTVYECAAYTKQRILEGVPMGQSETNRPKMEKLREECDIPPMPHWGSLLIPTRWALITQDQA